MNVRVLFFGVLKDIAGRSEDTVQIEPGSTVEDLFRSYSQRFETLNSRRPSILFARNREFVKSDAILSDNDEIAFLPPVSGGKQPSCNSASGHIFALTRNPIDSQALSRSLQRPEDGAVAVFEGVVRNNSNGRETLHLDYECYEPMALQMIERIGREIAKDHAIGHIGIVHRLGRLQIGEASVVIVATAPHRRPAFEAAIAGINRLKKEVPIWKKEFFADGAVWVDGEWDDALIRNSQGALPADSPHVSS